MSATLMSKHRWHAVLRGGLRRTRPSPSLFTLLILLPAVAPAQSPFDTRFTVTVAKVASLCRNRRLRLPIPGAKKSPTSSVSGCGRV
jgi:hypothetical protein